MEQPISVVTDDDLAMCNAIRNIFPHARHRLCSWHLERNAAKNVHRPEFVSDFTKLMQMECEVEEFESLWAEHGFTLWTIDKCLGGRDV